MRFSRPAAGRLSLIRSLAVAALLAVSALPVYAADEFPFDQVLLLDAAPMQKVKRMPGLTVAANGQATVELWCRTVAARVQVTEAAIIIDPAPLPEALPQYMSSGQCSEARIQADIDLLQALAEVTEWRRQGARVLLNGPTRLQPMQFRLSSH